MAVPHGRSAEIRLSSPLFGYLTSAPVRRRPARLGGVSKRLFYGTEHLDEFELLALGPLAVDDRPAVRRTLVDLDRIGIPRRRTCFECIDYSSNSSSVKSWESVAESPNRTHLVCRRRHSVSDDDDTRKYSRISCE